MSATIARRICTCHLSYKYIFYDIVLPFFYISSICLLPYYNPDVKFISAGREDVDVRMLGSGTVDFIANGLRLVWLSC